MIKLVALVRRRHDLSPQAFRDHWLGTQAPLARRIPGMRGYRINIAGDAEGMPSAPYDGSAEIWFDDRRSMDEGLASREGVIAGEDVPNFTASVTFLAFVACGLVPLAPYLLSAPRPLALSVAMTLVTFALIGAARSRWTLRRWWRCSLESLAVGAVAGLIAWSASLVVARTIGA